MAARRVLITGGAGFLGGHLADRLRKDGASVRLFDVARPAQGTRSSDVEYAHGDIRDAATVSAALEGVDTVIHAAFASPHDSPAVIRSVNVTGTQNLCAGLSARGVPRLILISSTIVLKPSRVHPLFRSAPLTRLDLYRASRVEAERIVTAAGMSTAVVRPKTFVGPGRVSAFQILFEWIRLGRAVPVLGSGRNRYQLLDIRDMVEGIHLLERATASGVFSLGARSFGTVQEDLQALIDHAGTGAQLRHVPSRLARAALRAMELACLTPLSEWHTKSAWEEESVVDISRAEEELDWRPERSNARALQEGYDWYAHSIATTGTAASTHAVPRVHRLLKAFHWLLPR